MRGETGPLTNTPSLPFVCVNVLAHSMTVTFPLPAAETHEASRLGALFDAHHQRLYRLARRLTSTADDARDLVQETFLRAARSPASIPGGPGQHAEAWLVRVLVNLQRDEWRRQSTKKRIDPEGEAHAARAEPADAESALIAKTVVWRALEQLDPRRRAAIVMYELDRPLRLRGGRVRLPWQRRWRHACCSRSPLAGGWTLITRALRLQRQK